MKPERISAGHSKTSIVQRKTRLLNFFRSLKAPNIDVKYEEAVVYRLYVN